MNEEIKEKVNYLNISEDYVKKSILDLGDRPSAQGISAGAIKEALFEPATKVFWELNRVYNVFDSAIKTLNGEATDEDSVKWLIAAAVAGLKDGADENSDTLKKLDKKITNAKTQAKSYTDTAIGSKVSTEVFNTKVAELEGDMACKLDAKFEAIYENKIRFLVAYPDGSIKAEKIATGGSY